jgi:hypothetical protein
MNTGEVVLPSSSTLKHSNDILNQDMENKLIENPTSAVEDVLLVPDELKEDRPSLPEEDDLRQQFPLATGLLDYFPNALAYVALISKQGGDKHHPGEPLHWERGKSMEHADKIMRHLVDRGKKDKHGLRHSGGLAWRALANLQEELEADEGYPTPRNATEPGEKK